MSKKSFIDTVEVKTPCNENWNDMRGNDVVRFCSHCAKDVNNLSEMTRKQAMRLVAASGGNLCVRYRIDPAAQRPVFVNQFTQIARRAPRVAAGVLGASITLAAHAYTQDSRPGTPVTDVSVVESATDRTAKPVGYKLSGTILDPNQAVIPGVDVSLASVNTASSAVTKTDENGVFGFENLPPGRYRIEAKSAGFDDRAKEIEIGEKDESVSIEMGVSAAASVVTINGGGIGDTRQFATMGVVAFSVTRHYTPLDAAIAADDVEAARGLIIRGANVNLKQKGDGTTPLSLAVEYGNVEMVEMLLTFRAKVNSRDSSKQTPIMSLDEDATPELARLLIRYGAKLNIVDTEGVTPLIKLAGTVNSEVLETLIRSGAEVNAASKEGHTALMAAAEANDLKSVRILLESGARVNAKNDEGETALDLTTDDEVEKLLETYGGVSGSPEEAEADDDSVEPTNQAR